MELNLRDWIEIIATIVLPVVGLIGTLILSGIKDQLKIQEKAHEALDAKIEALEKEQASWHADLPEKYARRDDLERTFNQLSQAILRVDQKLDEILHKGFMAK
jgi:peptidoglycan hydrolase CwlO-like protein